MGLGRFDDQPHELVNAATYCLEMEMMGRYNDDRYSTDLVRLQQSVNRLQGAIDAKIREDAQAAAQAAAQGIGEIDAGLGSVQLDIEE